MFEASLNAYPARQEEEETFMLLASQLTAPHQQPRGLVQTIVLPDRNRGPQFWQKQLGSTPGRQEVARAYPKLPTPPSAALSSYGCLIFLKKISSRGKQSKLVENNVKG